ncbi:DUF2971 domain-containing protein [Paenibacillus sp. FSL R5-0876]|uniref:DUF2971 domain-containing protein n=1 Tax=Paenibacillus sp. FSL R5-0876 TaxID=2921661 RepID=UPI0030F6B90D
MENLNIELGKLELNENVDSLLYHYTSINSLFSIIENKEFWVTRSDYMNDTSEVIYFREVVKKALDNHLNKACTSIEWVTWKQFIKDKLIYERSSLSSLIFILSFSKNPDSLSMWNYYGKNDGYNFGILKSDLDLMMKSKYRGGAMKSGSLIYEFDLQVDILVNELKNAFEIFCKNPSVEGILERVTSELSQRFFDYSFFFKHSAFKNEEEYRYSFLYMSNSTWLYRPYMGVIAPYVKIKDKDDSRMLSIKTITIGPLIKHERAFEGMKSWLSSKGYRHQDEIDLKKSSVPIRF